jgi:uncharacterized membrane protein
MISTRLAIYLVAPVLTIVFLVGSFSLASTGLLPDPVAIHWGVNGQADQFLDLNSYLWLVTISFLSYLSGLVALEASGVKAKLLKPLMKSLLVGLFFFILLVVITTTLLQAGLDTDESLFIGQWFLLVLIPVAIMVWLFSAKPSLRVQEILEIRLRGVVLLTVPLSAIESVSRINLQARDYGGWGLRYASNTLAFIPNSGAAVLIKLDWGEDIAVRMDNPQDFIASYQLETAG